MNARIKSVKARDRVLLRRACELGAQHFDEREGLIHGVVPGFPDRSGGWVAQHSIEYAIALLETGGDVRRANRIIERVLDFQVRDVGKVRYGNFIWVSHWKEASDANAVYFLVPGLVYLWTRHQRRLTARVQRRLQACWPLCVHAMHRHRVDWTYSNIFLLGVLSRFLLAPLLPRTDLDRDARAQWETFLKGTSYYGIYEYNSPTYIPVCIYALERLWAFGPRDLRKEFAAVLEYFYFEFAARYDARSGFLAGAMSRAYPWDMEAGGSYASLVAHRQWGVPRAVRMPFDINWVLTDYVAPERIRQIALHKEFPLEIRADAALKGITRTDYLTEKFTVGSQTGNWYGNQEVPLFITAGGCPLYVVPSISFAARLVSEQCGPVVKGLYYYDDASLAYQRRREKTRAVPAFDWRLGSRAVIRDVRVARAKLSWRIGDTLLRLSWRARSRSRVKWEGDQLVLSVPGKEIEFDLRLGKKVGVVTPPAGWKPRPHKLHQSRLANIGADDLLEFFRGRARPPWA